MYIVCVYTFLYIYLYTHIYTHTYVNSSTALRIGGAPESLSHREETFNPDAFTSKEECLLLHFCQQVL